MGEMSAYDVRRAIISFFNFFFTLFVTTLVFDGALLWRVLVFFFFFVCFLSALKLITPGGIENIRAGKLYFDIACKIDSHQKEKKFPLKTITQMSDWCSNCVGQVYSDAVAGRYRRRD